MDFQDTLDFVNAALTEQMQRQLTEAETAILSGAWNDQTYEQVAKTAGYSLNYLQRSAAPKFWKLLSQLFDRQLNKTNARAILIQLRHQKANEDRSQATSNSAITEPQSPSIYPSVGRSPQIDWGEAPDVSIFYGRSPELESLTHWIAQDGCRLVALLGMGGIGKSSLAARIAQQLATESFELIIWRSLHNAPPLDTLLADLVPFLSKQQDSLAKPERLLHWFRTHRCLVILDNTETVLQAGDRAGSYQPGYENYGGLFRLVGESAHQSCVVITSREKPAEIAVMEEATGRVRSLALGGSWEAALAILERKELTGTDSEKRLLCEFYNCSPLALKVVASSIQSLFDGNISEFLNEETLVFNGIRRLLEQHFERLSYLEQTIMYWLAINREWTAIAELQDDIVPTVLRSSLLEALESLTWRSLIEKKSSTYTQQPVVMEYVTDLLVEKFASELVASQSLLFSRHALIKTTSLDYIRESQIRLILHPLAQRLRATFRNTTELEKQLQAILQLIRNRQTNFFAYGIGNLINLLLHLQIDLAGYDFSNLKIRHAFLQGATLQQVNFQSAQFLQSVFTQTFGNILWVRFSGDGQRLAIGDTNGRLQVWQVDEMQLLLTIQAHESWVMSIAWSPDGAMLASGGDDCLIKLWDANTGQCIATLEKQTGFIWMVAWHPIQPILASCSIDGMVKLWDLNTQRCFQTFQERADMVMEVVWSPDGSMLASSSNDKSIRIWQTETGHLSKVLMGHESEVLSVAWSFDGKKLASGDARSKVRIWDVDTEICLQVLEGHGGWVRSMIWHPKQNILATGSDDQSIRLWNVETAQCLKVLNGHKGSIWTVSWIQNGRVLASGSYDQCVKLWDTNSGQCLKTLQGFSSYARALEWSPIKLRIPNQINEHYVLASAHEDYTIRLWDAEITYPLKTLSGHQNSVWTVAWSPDGQTLASGGLDYTIKIWDVQTGRCLKTLSGHKHWIRKLVWHPTQPWVASGSSDQTIKLWDIETGHCFRTIRGEPNWFLSVAWSPEGTAIASSSHDRTIRVWDVETGECSKILQNHAGSIWFIVWRQRLNTTGRKESIIISGSYDHSINLWDAATGQLIRTLRGHDSAVRSLSVSPDGKQLISASDDKSLRLWNLDDGRCLKTLSGHESQVYGVSWSADGQHFASSSTDNTIKIWDAHSTQCLNTLRIARPYEGMNIAGATGITDAQKATLIALGAVAE